MKKKWMPHIFASMGFVVFSVLALGSAASTPTSMARAAPAGAAPVEIILAPSWADYTLIPSKDYTVVGAVVVRNTTSETFLADLMDRAIAMGGHFIKNIRLSVVTEGEGRDRTRSVTVATATVIRYTDETLRTQVTETFMPYIRISDREILGGEPVTIINDRYFGLSGANE